MIISRNTDAKSVMMTKYFVVYPGYTYIKAGIVLPQSITSLRDFIISQKKNTTEFSI